MDSICWNDDTGRKVWYSQKEIPLVIKTVETGHGAEIYIHGLHPGQHHQFTLEEWQYENP